MKRWVKSSFLALLTCMVILVLAACGEEELQEVKVGEVTRSIFYAPQYVAIEKGFFEEKILPFLSENATVLIGIPGMKEEYAGRSEELLPQWLGKDACMFKSPGEWKEIIGRHGRIEQIETWKMGCFDLAWQDWLSTGNEYAQEDKKHFETIIRPYTCFVGIYIKIK